MGRGLTALAEQYPQESRDAILALAEKYRVRDEKEVLELAALAADVGLDDLLNLGLESDVNPQLMEALDKYPAIKQDLLATGELSQGQISNIKGKYFEILGRDRLNEGGSLGELQLAPGQTARLAESPTEKGWDLEIIGETGESVERLQQKATESMSYVKGALQDHPEYRVVVPAEMDSASEEIIGTDISHVELSEEVTADNMREQLEEQMESALENSVHVSAEVAFDAVPLGSLGVLVTIGGYRYLTGQATFREVASRSSRSLRRAVVWSAVGSGLAATGLGMGAIPATMGLRVAATRISVKMSLGDGLARRVQELNALRY